MFEIQVAERTGVPHRAAELIVEIAERCLSICKDGALTPFYIRRSWGELSEGGSFGLYREEYERFLELAVEALPRDRYFLQYERTEPFWPGPQCRLRIHGTLMEDPVHGELPIHQGVYLNIYALDALTNLKIMQQSQLQQYRKLQAEILSQENASEGRREQLLDRRMKFMTSKERQANWLIVYPMDPLDVGNTIISADELETEAVVQLPPAGDYSNWLFDIANDI